MDENNKGGGAQGWVQALLGSGGIGGAAGGVGDLICNIKGNCQPDNVTYVQAPPQNTINPLYLLGGALLLVVLLVFMLKK